MRIWGSLLGLAIVLLTSPVQSRQLKHKVPDQEFLRDTHVLEVGGTVVSLPSSSPKIDDVLPNIIQDNLRGAVRDAGFDASDSPVSIHFVIEAFDPGSRAARVLVGFGAGRSSITGHLILQNMDGKELASVRIHVNGQLDPYQKNSTQLQEAIRRLQQAMLEQIEAWK